MERKGPIAPNKKLVLKKDGTAYYLSGLNGEYRRSEWNNDYKYKRTERFLVIYNDFSRKIFYIHKGYLNGNTYIVAGKTINVLKEINLPDQVVSYSGSSSFENPMSPAMTCLVCYLLLAVCVIGGISMLVGSVRSKCAAGGCDTTVYANDYCSFHRSVNKKHMFDDLQSGSSSTGKSKKK